MFEVDLSTFFFIYLAFSLTGLFSSWVYFEFSRRTKRINPLEKRIFRCRICAHSYVVEKGETISRCPQCGSLSDLN